MDIWSGICFFARDKYECDSMSRLIVKNIGPIKSVDIELKKSKCIHGTTKLW